MAKVLISIEWDSAHECLSIVRVLATEEVEVGVVETQKSSDKRWFYPDVHGVMTVENMGSPVLAELVDQDAFDKLVDSIRTSQSEGDR